MFTFWFKLIYVLFFRSLLIHIVVFIDFYFVYILIHSCHSFQFWFHIFVLSYVYLFTFSLAYLFLFIFYEKQLSQNTHKRNKETTYRQEIAHLSYFDMNYRSVRATVINHFWSTLLFPKKKRTVGCVRTRAQLYATNKKSGRNFYWLSVSACPAPEYASWTIFGNAKTDGSSLSMKGANKRFYRSLFRSWYERADRATAVGLHVILTRFFKRIYWIREIEFHHATERAITFIAVWKVAEVENLWNRGWWKINIYFIEYYIIFI